jgi:PIN domain nuclease of toxin-antitoxin system
MRLLIDTHLAIWAITGDARLSAPARDLICDPENLAFVSAASIWEISIKHRLARTPADMPISGSEALSWFEQAGFRFLPVAPAHAAAVDQLQPVRADPFDLLLLAQARTEPMHLVTHDARLASCDSAVIRV